MSTVEFYQERGYWKDCEPRLREVAGDRNESFAMEAANQIKHLKCALNELIEIVEIHQNCTKNNFAWAELEFAKEAIGVVNETK
jgi:hypothetical protein